MLNSFKWPIVSICEKQRRDINKEDLLPDSERAYFRICNTKKAGNGYDQFSEIYFRRFKIHPGYRQFIVQLYGCPFNCKYCYVTKDGVEGKIIPFTSIGLSQWFAHYHSGSTIFHLMGGAPAIYLSHWKELASYFKIFHSDFLLIENEYRNEWLYKLPGLHAVSLKHPDDIGVNYDYRLLLKNLDKLIRNKVNFYLTFTGNAREFFNKILENKYGRFIFEDSFDIPIKKYKSLED